MGFQRYEANGSADKAGLQDGYKPITINEQRIVLGVDVILAIDRQKVSTIEDITQLLGKYQVGDQVMVSVIRGGEKNDVKVTLKQRP